MTFYQYLMKFRNPTETDDAARLANLVFKDSTFPRQSSDFDEISSYLETHAPFRFPLQLFDNIWQDYKNI
ncbi:MAG: YozE family protein [Streptococcaceae bacterium]|nr:YozE family protein [Streptococcaceae bacterium]